MDLCPPAPDRDSRLELVLQPCALAGCREAPLGAAAAADSQILDADTLNILVTNGAGRAAPSSPCEMDADSGADMIGMGADSQIVGADAIGDAVAESQTAVSYEMGADSSDIVVEKGADSQAVATDSVETGADLVPAASPRPIASVPETEVDSQLVADDVEQVVPPDKAVAHSRRLLDSGDADRLGKCGDSILPLKGGGYGFSNGTDWEGNTTAYLHIEDGNFLGEFSQIMRHARQPGILCDTLVASSELGGSLAPHSVSAMAT